MSKAVLGLIVGALGGAAGMAMSQQPELQVYVKPKVDTVRQLQRAPSQQTPRVAKWDLSVNGVPVGVVAVDLNVLCSVSVP